MQKVILTLVIGLSLSLALPAGALEVGQKLPSDVGAIQMKNVVGADLSKLDSNTTTIAANKGKQGTLVVFSCNTCPFVIKWKERLKKQIENFKKNDFGVIVINSNARQRDKEDSPKNMQEFAKSEGYSVPYVIDENNRVADVFNAERTPEIFLFNKDDVLVYHGAIDDDPDAGKVKVTYLADAMSATISGKKVEPSSTKSIGCSIKRVSDGKKTEDHHSKSNKDMDKTKK